MSTSNILSTSTSSTTHFDGKLAVGDYDPFMSFDSALPGPQRCQSLPLSKDAKPSSIEPEPTFLPSPSYLPPPPLPPTSNSREPSWYHGSSNTETTIPENELDSSFNNTAPVVVEESSSNAGPDPAWYHGEKTLTSLKDGTVSSPISAFGSQIQRERSDSKENRGIIRVENDNGSDVIIRQVSSRVEHVPKRSSVTIMKDEPTVTITSVTIEKKSEDGDVSKTTVIENGKRLDGGKFDEELWEQDTNNQLSPTTRYDPVKTEVVSRDRADDDEVKLSTSGKKIKNVEKEESKSRSKKAVSKRKEEESDDSAEENEEDDEEEGKKKVVKKSKETHKADDGGKKKVVKKTEKKKTKGSDDDSDEDDSDDSSEISSDSDDSEISSDSDSSDDSSEEKTKKKKKVVKKEGLNTEKIKVEKKTSGSAKKKPVIEASEAGSKTIEKKETSTIKKPAGSATDSSSAPKRDYPPLTGSDDDSTSDNEDKGKREKIKEKVKECIIS